MRIKCTVKRTINDTIIYQLSLYEHRATRWIFLAIQLLVKFTYRP